MGNPFLDETHGWADMTSALCFNLTELFVYSISKSFLRLILTFAITVWSVTPTFNYQSCYLQKLIVLIYDIQ